MFVVFFILSFFLQVTSASMFSSPAALPISLSPPLSPPLSLLPFPLPSLSDGFLSLLYASVLYRYCFPTYKMHNCSQYALLGIPRQRGSAIVEVKIIAFSTSSYSGTVKEGAVFNQTVTIRPPVSVIAAI